MADAELTEAFTEPSQDYNSSDAVEAVAAAAYPSAFKLVERLSRENEVLPEKPGDGTSTVKQPPYREDFAGKCSGFPGRLEQPTVPLFEANPMLRSSSSLLDSLRTSQLAEDTARVISTGDLSGLQNQLASSFEQTDCNDRWFREFCERLEQENRKMKVQTSFGRRSVSMQSADSPYGVAFELDANVNFRTGKMEASVTAQTYDVASGSPASMSPAAVVAGFRRR